MDEGLLFACTPIRFFYLFQIMRLQKNVWFSIYFFLTVRSQRTTSTWWWSAAPLILPRSWRRTRITCLPTASGSTGRRCWRQWMSSTNKVRGHFIPWIELNISWIGSNNIDIPIVGLRLVFELHLGQLARDGGSSGRHPQIYSELGQICLQLDLVLPLY